MNDEFSNKYCLMENKISKLENKHQEFDFFDNFLGKSDSNKVKKFLREKNFKVSNELQFSIKGGIFDDKLKTVFNIKPQFEIDVSNLFCKTNNNEERILTADELFNDINQNTEIFDINHITLVNSHIKISENSPLWYIFHSQANSSFGPISTKVLQNMYAKKVLNEDCKLRFIDTFNLKGCKTFDFFNLKEVGTKRFLERIVLSDLNKLFQSKFQVNN